MRAVLNNRCPLCGGNLAGHRHGGFAGFRIDGVEIRDRKDARERLFFEAVDRLPDEGANDLEHDHVWYAVLTCPILKEDAVIEHFSGADLFSEVSAVKLDGAPKDRISQFKAKIHDWLTL